MILGDKCQAKAHVIALHYCVLASIVTHRTHVNHVCDMYTCTYVQEI